MLVEEDIISWIEENLWIQTKDSRIIPFILNDCQRIFGKWIVSRIKEKKPLDAIILKARQRGISTLIEAIVFAITATHENVNSVVISHEQVSSEKIYRMTELYYDRLDEDIKPLKRRRNSKEIVFENPKEEERLKEPGLRSRIDVDTAQDPNAGRSATYQLVHCSEVAFWRDPSTLLTGLAQSVGMNMPLSGIILESTANGVGNYFHIEWELAKEGKGRYQPFFFDWLTPEYTLPFSTEAERNNFVLDEYEQRIHDKFGYTLEHLNWRRAKVEEFKSIAKSTTDPKKIGLTAEQLFMQEYPCEPIEAFLATGRPVFDRNILNWYKDKRIYDPETIGYLVTNRNGDIIVDKDKHGYLKIWEEPNNTEGYIIGGDFAEGLGTGDFTSYDVIKQSNMRQVAHWHGHIDAGLAAEQLEMLGYYYNTAFLVPEANNQGTAVCIHLQKANYPRVYMRRTLGMRYDKEKDQVGFLTNRATKPVIINHLIDAIRNKVMDIVNEETINELMTYIRDDKGLFGAQAGCFDDRVMSLALALEGHAEAPRMYGKDKRRKRNKNKQRRQRKEVNSYTGY